MAEKGQKGKKSDWFYADNKKRRVATLQFQ